MNRTISQLAKDFINCQDMVVTDVDYKSVGDKESAIPTVVISVRPKAHADNRCPICGRVCCRDGNGTTERLWRHSDANGILAYVKADTHRIKCPEHGTRIADVPWAYPGSFFTKDFDRMIAAFARELPKTFVAEYFRVDWHTVGRCISRTLNDLEPDRSKRLSGLKHIIVDETSYRKGYKYITVVLNADTREVVWVHLGNGKTIFEKFCKLLTPEQREAIKVVAGDGARWIDACTSEHFPNAERCVDPFHVVTWAMEALDAVRLEAWNKARATLRALMQEEKKLIGQAANREQNSVETQKNEEVEGGSQGTPPATGIDDKQEADNTGQQVGTCTAPSNGKVRTKGKKGKNQPAFTDEEQKQMDALQQRIAESQAEVNKYKSSTYALGKAPDHLTENQQIKLNMIAVEDETLFKAYKLKERLRLLLKMDLKEGREKLAEWIEDARSSGIPAFVELSAKILRHAENIENFMKLGISSAAIEATNNKIKLALRKARGFRNEENMIDMVYFVCSNIVIPRPHSGHFPRAYSAKGLFRYTDNMLGQEEIA